MFRIFLCLYHVKVGSGHFRKGGPEFYKVSGLLDVQQVQFSQQTLSLNLDKTSKTTVDAECQLQIFIRGWNKMLIRPKTSKLEEKKYFIQILNQIFINYFTCQ